MAKQSDAETPNLAKMLGNTMINFAYDISKFGMCLKEGEVFIN